MLEFIRKAYVPLIILVIVLMWYAVYLNEYITPYSSETVINNRIVPDPLGDKLIPWVTNPQTFRDEPLKPKSFFDHIFCALFSIRYNLALGSGVVGFVFFLIKISRKKEKGGWVLAILNTLFFVSAFYSILCVRWWGYG